ncbi:MAG TPA: hypothetical protein VGL99_04755 [Chloroflexota bacterium]|jgi:hypothetical protein
MRLIPVDRIWRRCPWRPRLSTRFKPISGRIDQAAGRIFRLQDGGNYYILRANGSKET